VWYVVGGGGLVTRESRHITVDLLYDAVPAPAQLALRVLGDLVLAGFLLLVLSMGLPIFLDSLRRPSPATGLPFFIFDGALWISSGLMIIHVTVNAARRWRPSARAAAARARRD